MKLRALAGAAALCLVIIPGANAARPRIVVLGPAEEPRFTEVVRGLGEGLTDQGRTLTSFDVVEVRVPRGETTRAQAKLQEALRLPPDVVFVIGSVLARIARDAAPDVPVVFITPGDPVAAGLAASFQRPGGNATALMFEYPELSGKRLVTYGASDIDAARDAARLVDKILRGARAGDLPIERPTRLRLVINQKTATTLGLILPDAVVLRADETIN